MPRKRCTRSRGKIKAFPRDDPEKACHLTGFIGYKAGCTHILREMNRKGSKSHKREVVEMVTILESPPMIVVGLVGYKETPEGLKALTTVWANHIAETMKRRMCKSWKMSRKNQFSKYAAHMETEQGQREFNKKLKALKKYCSVIRVICHTQIRKVKIITKKAHVIEIQVNGGTIAEKVDYGLKLFEREVPIKSVFADNEMIDISGITKGRGFKGVVSRWGVTRLPRKTHRGLRKVACIGSWHPARVQFGVARAGQKGYHHRTEVNKKIYRIGDSMYGKDKKINYNAMTENDLTKKTITPMGGFVNFGIVREDYLMLKGSVMGPPKRCVMLRKAINPSTSRMALEEVKLKFIDTSSKLGHGRWQTSAEKIKFFGPTKKNPGPSSGEAKKMAKKTRKAEKKTEKKK